MREFDNYPFLFAPVVFPRVVDLLTDNVDAISRVHVCWLSARIRQCCRDEDSVQTYSHGLGPTHNPLFPAAAAVRMYYLCSRSPSNFLFVPCFSRNTIIFLPIINKNLG